MPSLDRAFVLTGLVWLMFGMAFGIWMGVTERFNFANSHAHVNLVGFTLSTLFGLLHRGWPRMAGSRLALPQFLVFELGAVLLVGGKIMVDDGGSNLLVKVGSVVTLVGAAAMLVLFARHGKGA